MIKAQIVRIFKNGKFVVEGISQNSAIITANEVDLNPTNDLSLANTTVNIIISPTPLPTNFTSATQALVLGVDTKQMEKESGSSHTNEYQNDYQGQNPIKQILPSEEKQEKKVGSPIIIASLFILGILGLFIFI